MVSVTLSLPEEVREKMKRFPEVNWSAFIRKCIDERARSLTLKEEMLNELKNQKGFDSWAVELVRAGRKK